jgi:hypothetical protein
MIEKLEPEERDMKPVEYQEPFCHGIKMANCFTYRNAKSGIYRQFVCLICKHYESRCIAVPV